MLGSGQDYLRSKKGVQNTYQRGDLNALNYNQFAHNKEFHEWTRKLISFRSSKLGNLIRLPCILPHEQYRILDGPENSFGLLVYPSALDDTENDILLILVNPSDGEVEISLPMFNGEQKKLLSIGQEPLNIGTVYPISIQVWLVG